jgi:hypothetical protein
MSPGWVHPSFSCPGSDGRVVRADKPFLRTGWLAEASADDQARLHAGFLDLLAGIHRIDMTAGQPGDFLPGAALRATNTTLAGEVDRWAAT